MKTLITYIKEGKDKGMSYAERREARLKEYQAKLAEKEAEKNATPEQKLQIKLKKQQEKIDKMSALVEKKIKQFNSIIEKYKKNETLCKLIPFEVFNNFKWISWSDTKKLAAEMGVQNISFPYNPLCGQMYYDKDKEIRLRHNITNDTKSDEQNWKDYVNDEDSIALNDFYWHYFTKANELIEDIHRKQQEIKSEEEKVIKVSDSISTAKEKEKHISTLFEQLPELQDFLDEVTEKQIKFNIEQNEKLKKEWDTYKAEVAKLDEIYGNEWSASCNRRKDNGEGLAKYQELKKIKPSKWIRTEEQIKRECEAWKRNERILLAERITTEFGGVKSAELHISGKDGNVNGTIVGEKKTAKIETIYAGGYNIQCLHTRLLVHEY